VQRNEFEVIAQPLCWIEVLNKLDKLENLVETRQENKDSFLLFNFEVIFEGVLPVDYVADDDRGNSHDTLLD